MSKEHDNSGLGDAFRVVAAIFLGFMTAFYPENTGPGKWAAEKKKKLKHK